MSIDAVVLRDLENSTLAHSPRPDARFLVGAAEIDAIRPEWENLYGDAVEPNPCYAPAFACHFIDATRPHGSAGVVAVRERDPTGAGRLIGLLPVRVSARTPIRVSALHTPFFASTVPLLRRGYERAGLAGLLGWMNAHFGPLCLLRFDELRLDGPIWHRLRGMLAEQSRPYRVFGDAHRPLIDTASADTAEQYQQRLHRKTRQTLRRKKRQLEALGCLTFTAHRGPDLGPAMREFLHLEQRGWKGAAGTAMAQSAETLALVEDVLADEASEFARIDSLRLDGHAIAMSIHIGGGGSALHFKPAYDESYARYSPGMLLHMMTIEHLYADGWATCLDSATKPEDQISAIWRDRRHFGSVLIGASPRTPGLWLGGAASLCTALVLARAATKSVVHRLMPVSPR